MPGAFPPRCVACVVGSVALRDLLDQHEAQREVQFSDVRLPKAILHLMTLAFGVHNEQVADEVQDRPGRLVPHKGHDRILAPTGVRGNGQLVAPRLVVPL